MKLLNFNFHLLVSGMITISAVYVLSLMSSKLSFLTPSVVLYLLSANLLYVLLFKAKKLMTNVSRNPDERIHNSMVYLFHIVNITAAIFLLSSVLFNQY